MKRLKMIGILVAGLLSGSCRKGDSSISFGKPRQSYDLAVEGGINTLQRTQYIKLSKPSLHPDSLPGPVRGAVVEVNDGQHNILFKETATAGVYSGVVNNNTNYNQAYRLSIHYNSKVYTASDTLRQVINIIDDYLPLSVVRGTAGKVKGVIPRHTFGYLNSSKWWISYSGVSAWNPALFDQMLYYSYTHSHGSPNSQYPLTDQNRDFTLSDDDNITIYKFSMSESYSRYLYSLFQETEWKGVFSAVPGKVKGNISEGGEGYFYVTDVDLRRYKAGELVQTQK